MNLETYGRKNKDKKSLKNILVIIIVILFLISGALSRRNANCKDTEIEKVKKEIGTKDNVDMNNYRQDPYLGKNIFILATVFINVIIFIILAFAVFNYSLRPSINLNLYLIAGISLYIISVAVYLVRSKIIG